MSRFVHLLFISLILPAHARALDRQFQIEWENISGAKQYMIQFLDEHDKLIRQVSSLENKMSLKLPVGSYRYRIRSIDSDGAPGIWGPFFSFVLKMPNIKILRPSQDEVKKVSAANEYTQEFAWEKNLLYEKYQLVIKDDYSPIYSQVVSGTSVQVSLPADHNFRWGVLGLAENQTPQENLDTPYNFKIQTIGAIAPIIEISEIGADQILHWQQFHNSDQYQLTIYQMQNGQGSGKAKVKQFNGLKETMYVVPTDLAEGQYEYEVTAEGGQSASLIASRTTRGRRQSQAKDYFLGAGFSMVNLKSTVAQEEPGFAGLAPVFQFQLLPDEGFGLQMTGLVNKPNASTAAGGTIRQYSEYDAAVLYHLPVLSRQPNWRFSPKLFAGQINLVEVNAAQISAINSISVIGVGADLAFEYKHYSIPIKFGFSPGLFAGYSSLWQIGVSPTLGFAQSQQKIGLELQLSNYSKLGDGLGGTETVSRAGIIYFFGL